MVLPRPDAPVPLPIPAIFFGSPAFAVPTLRLLAGDERFDVRLVVTQPPRPAGRGRHLQRSAVHESAEAFGLAVLAPDRLRDPVIIAMLAAAQPSLFVVAAYGKILRPEVLALPDHGTLNVHASLLPAYRGASPIHAALLDGVNETGVSIMLMDIGLDTGPVLAQARVPIAEDATTRSLTATLAEVGASLLVETAVRWVRGETVPIPQDDAAATITHLITKEEGSVRWELPAGRIARMERAFQPWPGVYTFLAGTRVLLHGLSAAASSDISPKPGTLLAVGKEGLRVRAGDGDVLIGSIQPAGRSPVSAEAYARGRPGLLGMQFSTTAEAPG